MDKPGVPNIRPSWLMMGIAVIGVIGAFLPWATFGIFSVAGTDGDGVITLILFIVFGLIGLWLGRQGDPNVAMGVKVLSIVLMAVVVVIAVYDIANISSEGDSFIKVSPGGGLYLTLISGIAGLIVAARLTRTASSSTTAAD